MKAIDNLVDTPKSELLRLWARLPGKKVPPPSRVDRLIRELAYRLQEQTHGRLDKNTTVSLRRHMAAFERSLAEPDGRRDIKPARKVVLEVGSTITRDWNGQTITVQVLGTRRFEFDGTRYKSLSAVARKVTGQHLSGPLFFDLKEVSHA